MNITIAWLKQGSSISRHSRETIERTFDGAFYPVEQTEGFIIINYPKGDTVGQFAVAVDTVLWWELEVSDTERAAFMTRELSHDNDVHHEATDECESESGG